MSLQLHLSLPFIASAVAALRPASARHLESSWAAAIALVVALQPAVLYPDTSAGSVLTERLLWLPSMGIDVVVRLDGFAWMFALLTSVLSFLPIGCAGRTARTRAAAPAWPSPSRRRVAWRCWAPAWRCSGTA